MRLCSLSWVVVRDADAMMHSISGGGGASAAAAAAVGGGGSLGKRRSPATKRERPSPPRLPSVASQMASPGKRGGSVVALQVKAEHALPSMQALSISAGSAPASSFPPAVGARPWSGGSDGGYHSSDANLSPRSARSVGSEGSAFTDLREDSFSVRKQARDGCLFGCLGVDHAGALCTVSSPVCLAPPPPLARHGAECLARPGSPVQDHSHSGGGRSTFAEAPPIVQGGSSGGGGAAAEHTGPRKHGRIARTKPSSRGPR
jgi:hypothetical protein